MPRTFIDSNAHYGKCPFCGLNKQYLTTEIKRRYNYIIDGTKVSHAIEAVIHCHKCGAMMCKVAADQDSAIQAAIDQWRSRE